MNSTFQQWALTAALGVTLGFVTTARADQTDPRLNTLFEQLMGGSTITEVEAMRVTDEIWTLWTESGQPDAQARLDEGIRNMQDREFAAAVAAFSEVIQMLPNFAEGWNKRATVYFMMGEYARSAEDVKRTLELEPRHFGALSGLGLLYGRMDRPEAAIAAFREALDVNPFLPGPRRNIQSLEEQLDSRRKTRPSA